MANDNKKQVVMAARVITMVARAMVTGAKRAMAMMAVTATMAMTAMTVAMAKMTKMMPNSNDAASGNKGNKDTKQWQWKQRQWRTLGIVNPEEAQDAAIAPMAVPQWCLLHHTVASHRIDPMEEYIKIWKKNLDRENNLDRLPGQPIQICYKMTKKRPCTQSGFAKKRTLEQKSC
jgi:hypothetical protein